MLPARIIPFLLVHDGGLVKKLKFKHAKYVGVPINAVKIFSEKEADELMALDIDASKVVKQDPIILAKTLHNAGGGEFNSALHVPVAFIGGLGTLSHIR